MSQTDHTAHAVRISLDGFDRTANRRLAEERFMVRRPGLYRYMAAAFFRLPRRSRIRRSLIVRRVERAYAAANRRDFEVILVGLHPHTEYRPAPDLIAPDQPAVFHGHDGYMAMWRNWLGAFEDLRFDPEEVLDFGDTFLVSAQQRAHGTGSGIAVEKPVFQLFRIEKGLVVWQHDFSDRSKALEALRVGSGRYRTDRR
jgi:ketosteroid isomerase-like protein